MGYARRTDANQSTLVAELEQAGFSVTLLHRVGNDIPDLLVGRNGVDRQVEIKPPTGPRGGVSHRTRSKGQLEYAASWRGAPVILARCCEDVLREFDKMMRCS